MCSLLNAVPELQRMERQKEIEKKLSSTQKSMLKGVLFNTQNIIERGYQYM